MEPAFNPALTKDDVNQCPLFRYTGQTVLIQTEDELRDAIDGLRHESVLGFDTETKPTFRKGKVHSPALVQLATSDKVYIFQLKKLPLDGRLAHLLSNPAIIKTGVAIADDMRSLRALHSFEPAGLVDLSSVARSNNIGVYSLRGLAACFLGVRISKSERCSNWAAATLSDKQIVYAATDAWVSREIYMQARDKGFV